MCTPSSVSLCVCIVSMIGNEWQDWQESVQWSQAGRFALDRFVSRENASLERVQCVQVLVRVQHLCFAGAGFPRLILLGCVLFFTTFCTSLALCAIFAIVDCWETFHNLSQKAAISAYQWNDKGDTTVFVIEKKTPKQGGKTKKSHVECRSMHSLQSL